MSHLILNSTTTHSNSQNIASALWRFTAVCLLAGILSACSSTDASKGGGRYAMANDAPPDDSIVLDPDNIPDAIPTDEPRTAAGNKTPYTVLGETYSVMPESSGYTQTGKASWYGKKFHGHKTSNGEIYNMYKMSAAHKSLPIPSYVRVTNLANGRSGIVRVNDRGPFHSERIIDISYAAAVKLDVVRTGTAHVRIEAIEPSTSAYAARAADLDELPASKSKKASTKPAAAKLATSSTASTKSTAVVAATADIPIAPTASGSSATYLQAGAFRNEDSANTLRAKLAELTGKPVTVDSAQGLFKVRIGPLADHDAVHATSELLVQHNFSKPQVVHF